jgi:septum formation inhibitor-activating ATPase MinD
MLEKCLTNILTLLHISFAAKSQRRKGQVLLENEVEKILKSLNTSDWKYITTVTPSLE